MKKSEWNHQRYRIEVKSLFEQMYGGCINPLTPPYRYTVRLANNREQDTGNNYLLIEWGKDGTFADAKLFGITVLIGTDEGKVYQTEGLNDCFGSLTEASEYVEAISLRLPDDFSVKQWTEIVGNEPSDWARP